jgi:hypothetical protein
LLTPEREAARRLTRTRYRLGMAEPKGAQAEDVVSRLADAGEEALRRLLGLPRRMVVGALHAAGERLEDGAAKLRGIDQLQRRVAKLERRLDSLEKPTATTARRSSPRAKPTRAAGAGRAVAVEPQQDEPDHGRGEGRATDEPEQSEAPAADDSKPAP